MDEEASSGPDKVEQEILDAKKGVLANVSNKAAARYLGISTKTLYHLVNSLEGPPVLKALPTGKARNQHLHFPFQELELWNKARIQYPNPKKRRLVMEELEWMRLRQELWSLEEQAERIRKQLNAVGDPWYMRR